jgi:hypothetical protein
MFNYALKEEMEEHSALCLPATSQDRNTQLSLDRKLGGSQSQYRCPEEEIFCPVQNRTM